MDKFDREQFIESVKAKPSLHSNNEYTYYITHEADEDGEWNLFLKSTIDPETMELLIYSFQSIAWDVNTNKVLWQPDVEKILVDVFDAQEVKRNVRKNTAYRIDLYDNWECWTGVDDEIMKIDKLKNERVVEVIQEVL